jgi:hypothetical protein
VDDSLSFGGTNIGWHQWNMDLSSPLHSSINIDAHMIITLMACLAVGHVFCMQLWDALAQVPRKLIAS